MLHVLNHPLITHKLAIMRRVTTGTKDFRDNLEELAGLMAYEISRDIPVNPVTVETPMGLCDTFEMAKDIVLVPILRAGLGMVDGILNL
ncbi:MAG: uracil phosphoribosyltransferase, partial [Firmicutes bacterium HGW-Firmicutes-19]